MRTVLALALVAAFSTAAFAQTPEVPTGMDMADRLGFTPGLPMAIPVERDSEPTDRPAPVVPPIDLSAPPSDAAYSPAAQAVAPPPPINLFSEKDAVLSASEKATVSMSQRWMSLDGPGHRPAAGDNGAVVFRYGAAMPTVVCAPLYVCDIALQPGEKVTTVAVGDPIRWSVSPAISGAGAAAVTHAIVKPSDIGLRTNLLITTDRRAYSIRLVSRLDDWMPAVAFAYPEDEERQWAAMQAQADQVVRGTVLPQTGQSIADLDFAYELKGDKPNWRPVRVYHDGTKTYIQFPGEMRADESPALVAIGPDKKESMVNYRVLGDRYVVDKVLDRALLVSGVGRHQVKVRIEREG